MRQIKIRKNNGTYRTIYVPDADEKRRLQDMLPRIARIAERGCSKTAVHGFMRGRSPVTNARAHIEYNYTLSFDLKDFFDSISAKHLKGRIPQSDLDVILVDGAPRQGLPTSPAASNIAACPMDRDIIKQLSQRGRNPKKSERIVYTRYADDLTISFDNPLLEQFIRVVVAKAATKHGFEINTAKTALQKASQGRRIICGIGVDKTNIHPTRSVKRRLRAALHQNKRREARGFAEWCKLKPPTARHALNVFPTICTAIKRTRKISRDVASMNEQRAVAAYRAQASENRSLGEAVDLILNHLNAVTQKAYDAVAAAITSCPDTAGKQ